MNNSDPDRWKKASAELARALSDSVEVFKKIGIASAVISQQINDLTMQGRPSPDWLPAQFGELIHNFHSTYVRFLADLDRIHAGHLEILYHLRTGESPTPKAVSESPLSIREDQPTTLREKYEGDLLKMIDRIPAMVGYWDKNLRNRFANQDYSSWFGLAPKDILGKHIREVIGEERFTLNFPYMEAVLLGRPQHFERIITDPSGRVRTALAHYIPDIQDGQVIGFYAIVADAVVSGSSPA